MSELDDIRERVTKAAADILSGIREIEHALADCTTVESAHIVLETTGGCYAAFDRINAAATSRYAHLDVARIMEAERQS